MTHQSKRSLIRENTYFRVYHYPESEFNGPVIIKVLKDAGTDQYGGSVLQHEYDITRALKIKGVRRALSMTRVDGNPALILEYFPGKPLKQLAGDPGMTITGFLDVFLRILHILGALHNEHIIHKNINSNNILLNAETGELMLFDFSEASKFDLPFEHMGNPTRLSGDLAYISPEQTGRMNRIVDYRSDIYSMGVVFYEMLTGRLPFTGSDPLELVHAHMAKEPPSLEEIRPEIPSQVSRIVLKMLAKNAEDRYQTVRGIQADIEICRGYLLSPKRAGDPGGLSFELARNDVSGKFQIPQKLYGRAKEISSLLKAYQQAASGGREVVLVSGNPGVGKSALVAEVHKPITRYRGFFVSGKFEQYQQSVPYAAFIQAFNQLADLLLMENENVFQQYRDEITASLGENGSVITEFIPGLENVIGRQKPVSSLGAQESRNRFNLAFQRFMRSLCMKEHPLVLFIDDWQWADSASLDLLKVLLSDEALSCFMLVMAYRDNEVPRSHPFALVIKEIEKSDNKFHSIALSLLKEPDIKSLVAETLNCSLESAAPLTEFVYKITMGNPFFTNQLLKSLHSEGMISFNYDDALWRCDLARVNALDLTDDVIKFMGLQLQKLQKGTLEALKIASCMGNFFDVPTLSVVMKNTGGQLISDLEGAVKEGLVLPLNPGHQKGTYRFIHDRVQQAAYALIPEQEKKATHYDIGMLLYNATDPAGVDQRIFEIVNHLNQGIGLEIMRESKIDLAQLNYQAGQKAKDAAAFTVAGEYFSIGRSLLPPDSWQKRYQLTLNLYESSAEAAYLTGDFKSMESLTELLIEKAKTHLDTVKVIEVNIQALSAQNRFMDAINLGLGFLKKLGVEFPENPGQEDIAASMQVTQSVYNKDKIADLINIPLMTDPEMLAAMRIMISISPPTFFAIPMLFILLTLKEVYLSITSGNTPSSTHCYSSYGLFLCGVIGDFNTGYEFGRLALALLEKLKAREMQSRVNLLVHGFIFHWKEHAKNMIVPLQSAYTVGLETGDLEFASYSAAMYCCIPYYSGIVKGLTELQQDVLVFTDSLYKLKQVTTYQYLQMLKQALHDIREGRQHAKYLQGEYYDEIIMLPVHLKARDHHGLYYLYSQKLILSYLFGEYEQAVEDADNVLQYIEGGTGFPYVPVGFMFDSLARLAVLKKNSHGAAGDVYEKVQANQKMMAVWASFAPENCQHMFDLVEAVRNQMLGNMSLSIELYDRAIIGARETGHIRDEAIANECAAEFYLGWGKETIAAHYAREARSAYTRWEAWAKVKQMVSRFGGILSGDADILTIESGSGLVEGKITKGTGTVSLDLTTVLKAAHAVSSQIELNSLLEQLMYIAIENAGARRGILIIERGGIWNVEARAEIEDNGIKVTIEHMPLKKALISKETVSHVLQSRRSLLLDDASQSDRFREDPYIKQHKVKSIMCVPLVNQGKISGILYLENNLTAAAFSPERVELLNVLSSQMALALDNARLYEKARQEIIERRAAEEQVRRLNEELEKRVEERTTQLEEINKELEAFSYSVSHDLRTPLRAVDGYTRILIEDYCELFDDEGKRICGVIQTEAQRMGELIDDLLSLSRLGRSEMQIRDIDMMKLVKALFNELVASEMAENMDIIIGDLPPAPGDYSLMRQVWMNLISNAVKFSSKKERPVIEVTGTAENDRIVYCIKDNGAGFNMEYADKLFGVFQRLHKARDFEGTGVGLAIVQRILRRHGGLIWAEAEPDKGAAFYFTLPF